MELGVSAVVQDVVFSRQIMTSVMDSHPKTVQGTNHFCGYPVPQAVPHFLDVKNTCLSGVMVSPPSDQFVRPFKVLLVMKQDVRQLFKITVTAVAKDVGVEVFLLD